MAKPHSEEGIGALLVRMVEDGKAFAQAEVELVRTQFVVRWASAKLALAFGLAALLLVHAAIIGLVIGLILILTRPVGPAWATVIVIVGVLVMAGLLGWLAARKASAAISPKENGA